MNLENLHKLQILTKHLSLLYVEDNFRFQKQVVKFLNKIFPKVYQAYDGADGLDQYIKYTPDLILTNLTMPNKDGVEMIMDIRRINPDVKIIVLSKDDDNFELLQTIDLDITEFLLKPLNIDKLINALIKGAKKEPTKDEIECFNKLKDIYKKNQEVVFYNHYKGIPIKNHGTIIDIKDDEIYFKVPYIQTIAIDYEKNTMMELISDSKYVESYLVRLEKEDNIVILTGFKFTTYSSRDFKNKRLLVDSSFKVGLYKGTQQISVKAVDVTFVSINLVCYEKYISLNVDDEVTLTFGFQIKAKNSLIHQDLVTKAFATGKVIRIEKNVYDTTIIVSMNLKKSSQSTFIKYLKQRELETIKELQRLLKKS